MSDAVIPGVPLVPQKRLNDGSPVFDYQTRSKTEKPEKDATPLPQETRSEMAYRTYDFEPEKRAAGIDDLPRSRGFLYSACAPSLIHPALRFVTTDAPPFRPSLNVFDEADSATILDDCRKATSVNGWGSVRFNTPISEGKVFFEFIIHESDAERHVRIGLTRRGASIEAPVGYDGYGYGLRDIHGHRLHLSRPSEFPGLGGGFAKGDVIGFLVELPKIEEFQDIVREHSAFRHRKKFAFLEKFDYVRTKEMDHLLNPLTVFGEKAVADTNKWKPESLKGSKVTVYKNGKLAGVAFEDLYAFLPPHSELHMETAAQKDHKYFNNGLLGYYPTVSAYRGGVAEVNAGPDFKFEPEDLPNDVKGLHEIYAERIADDIVWDIVDEIDLEAMRDPSLGMFL